MCTGTLNFVRGIFSRSRWVRSQTLHRHSHVFFLLFFHRRDEQPVKAQAVDEQHVSGAESLSIRWAILLPQMFNNQ